MDIVRDAVELTIYTLADMYTSYLMYAAERIAYTLLAVVDLIVILSLILLMWRDK